MIDRVEKLRMDSGKAGELLGIEIVSLTLIIKSPTEPATAAHSGGNRSNSFLYLL